MSEPGKLQQLSNKQPGGSKTHVLVWLFHLALPMLGLVLLVTQPSIDLEWQHHESHFWLIAGIALLNVVLGARINEEAGKRDDARLFFVSLGFLASAGFLCLHALATPGVIVDGKNSGFELATPFGLLLGALFAVVSSVNFTPESSRAVLSKQAPIRVGLLLLLVAWGVISLGGIEPLATPLSEQAETPLATVAAIGAALYLLAILRYFRLYRENPSPVLLGVMTAFALLAEALITVVVARSWKISWWEWHLLTAGGYGFVAYSAYIQYRRQGASSALFNSIGLEHSIEELQSKHGSAVEEFAQAVNSGDQTRTTEAIDQLTGLLDLTPKQTESLRRAANLDS